MNAKMEAVKKKLNEARKEHEIAALNHARATDALDDKRARREQAQAEFNAALAEWMKQ